MILAFNVHIMNYMLTEQTCAQQTWCAGRWASHEDVWLQREGPQQEVDMEGSRGQAGGHPSQVQGLPRHGKPHKILKSALIISVL